MNRTFVADLDSRIGEEVRLCGWVHRYRETRSTVFIVLQDASGRTQIVAGHDAVKEAALKTEDCVEIVGKVRAEQRAKQGFEVDLLGVKVLNRAGNHLPFTSGTDLTTVGQDVMLDYRPMTLRTDRGGTIFRVQAALVEGFRSALRRRRFTEIISSKIVASGTEGGTNLFEIKYFERAAYLAQSPQFYKEHGVCGLERVFETGHVYRAEKHATSRHLTEYYSLDFEMGFIEGPKDVMETEREVLTEIFEGIRRDFDGKLEGFDPYLPSLEKAPIWDFDECVDRLKKEHGRTDLVDDLDPEGERQICDLAEKEFGVKAAFVTGFPMSARPFYTKPRADGRTAAGFDLLFRGVEITTGGQRLHTREDLESALRGKGMDPASFEGHLRMFDLGMPPHGGLAIGLERLTMQVLGFANVREATLYPRDRHRVEP
jgi:nondiscriminating aspartyl-tRNA synthetase